MLVGILSDTHDRLTTLEKALAEFKRRKVDAVIHCGDLVAPFAARRLKDLITVEDALTAGLGIVRRELDRWRNVAAGSPRKRGEWRSFHETTTNSSREVPVDHV